MNLLEIATNAELMEVARKAIENALVEFREARLSQPTRNSGLVIREKDGCVRSIIRMGPEHAVYIGLTAIAAHLAHKSIERTSVLACHKCGAEAVLTEAPVAHIGSAMLCSTCIHLELDEPPRGEDLED